MNCPTCNSRTKVLTVHDENPFAYHECVECGWDDYESSAIAAADPGEDEEDEEAAPLSFDGDQEYES